MNTPKFSQKEEGIAFCRHCGYGLWLHENGCPLEADETEQEETK